MRQRRPPAPPPPAPAMNAPSANAPAPAEPPPNAVAPAPASPAASEPAPGEHMVSAADLPQDLSPWGMFKDADLVVKAVILGLAFASLVTWTVWLAKTLELTGARAAVRRDIRTLSSATTFAQAHEQ